MAQIGATSEQQTVPLRIWAAIRSGDLPALRDVFRSNPAEIDGYTFFVGGTYLHLAASIGTLETVKC